MCLAIPGKVLDTADLGDSRDWAMAPLTEAERRDFLEICDARCQARFGAAHKPNPDRLLALADR
jgi:hypothetical protein